MPTWAFVTIKFEPLVFVKARDFKSAVQYVLQKYPDSIGNVNYLGDSDHSEVLKIIAKGLQIGEKLTYSQAMGKLKKEGLEQIPYVDLTVLHGF
jgi:hypothetical protein